MRKEGEFIYNICTKHTRQALEAFCRTINDSKAEVFVVMAQKAIRLIEILIEQGLIDNSIASRIVSNNAIAYDPQYFADKYIDIIDDIIISGSSISATAAKLTSIGIDQDHIGIIALAKDESYQTIRFTNTKGDNILKCNYCLKDPECIELSYDLSRIFQYYGKPYNTDFPMYDTLLIDDIGVSTLLNPLFVDVYDISDDMLHDNTVSKLVLFPTEEFCNDFWRGIGLPLNSLFQLKIRMAITAYPDGSKTCDFVPMALLNETSFSTIQLLWERLGSAFSESNVGLSVNDKVHILQYCLAHHLAVEYFKAIGWQDEDRIRINPDRLICLFGPSNEKRISTILDSLQYEQSSVLDGVHLDVFSPYLMGYNDSECIVNWNYSIQNGNMGYIANEILLSPIMWWYKEYELPARKALMNPVLHYLDDSKTIYDKLTRLRTGFSLNALTKILFDKVQDTDCARTASLFIDRAIDEGIVVPIVYCNEEKGQVCRAYRHGEDLPFGMADKCRMLYFMKSLGASFSKTPEAIAGIAPVSLEKLIVLFYQIGLKDGGLFNRFLGFDNIPILYERFCVHGAIISFEKPSKKNIGQQNHIYYEKLDDPSNDYSSWLTWWMLNQDNGFIKIKRIHNRTNYIIDMEAINNWLDQQQMNCISNNIQNKIEMIADILGLWYRSNLNQKDEFKRDATAVTSCNNIYSFASALATELHYFKRYWDGDCLPDLNTFLTNIDDTSNLFYRSRISRVLNSGVEKCDWFDEKRAIKVINDVEMLLKDKVNYCLYWKKIWDDSINTSITSEQLTQKVYEAKGYLFFFYALYIALCEGSLLSNESSLAISNNERADDLKKRFLACVAKNRDLDPNLFVLFNDISEINDIQQKINYLREYIGDVILESERVVNEIEELLDVNASSYNVYYQSCLIFDVRPIKAGIHDVFMSVWRDLEENIQKTRLNIFYFGKISNLEYRYGIFYDTSINLYDFVTNEPKDNPLMEVYNKVIESLCLRSYSYKAMFIPRLPSKAVFKHNLRKNISKSTSMLNEILLRHLEKEYLPKRVEQLLYVSTRGTDVYFKNQVGMINWSVKGEEKALNISGYTNERITVQNYAMDLPFSISGRINEQSTVAIYDNMSNKLLGTGILVRFYGMIYCVSCQHIFKGVADDCIEARIGKAAYRFKLKLLNRKSNSNTAKDEVAILMPIWNGRILLQTKAIFSERDLTNKLSYESSNFDIYGFSNENGAWINGLTLFGAVDDGYYKLQADDSYQMSGMSGAAIISQDNLLLGLHKRHDNDIITAIPACAIKDVLNSVKKDIEKGW